MNEQHFRFIQLGRLAGFTDEQLQFMWDFIIHANNE